MARYVTRGVVRGSPLSPGDVGDLDVALAGQLDDAGENVDDAAPGTRASTCDGGEAFPRVLGASTQDLPRTWVNLAEVLDFGGFS